MKLALRDLFWAVLIAAIGIAWGMEHMRIAKALASAGRHDTRSVLLMPDNFGLPRRPQSLAGLQTLSDEELNGSSHYHLQEMSRRRLSKKVREVYENAKARIPLDPNDPTAPPYWDNRGLLTALRRAEGKPDPIQIEVASIDNAPTVGPMVLPRIKNVDVDGERVFSQSLGEFRGSQYWRVQLRDSQGRLMEGLDTEVFMWQGLHMSGMLPNGAAEDHDFSISARKQVKPPRSGKYSLVLIHADSPIANNEDLAGRIYWQSAPVPVIVENLALATKWELIRLPIAIVAVVLVVGFASLGRSILPPKSSPSKFWLNARDWFAVSVIALLAVGWSCDIFLMKDRMDKSDLDLQSNWTMRLAR